MAGDQRLKGCIEILINNIKNVVKFHKEQLNTSTLRQCQWQLSELTDSYKSFVKYQSQLEEKSEDKEVDMSLRNEIKTIYMNIGPDIEQRMDDIKESKIKPEPQAPVNPAFPIHAPRLPEIVLDNFSGDLMKWTDFINSFDGLVHNNKNLADITKFQYLRSSLSGTAKTILENLDFVGENYPVARQLLLDQFENPKRITEEHMRALFTFKPLDKACSKRLTELVNHFNSHIRSLAHLQRPIEHCDDFLVYLIVSKFDTDTRSKWIDYSPTSTIASYDVVKKFITTRCIKLESQTTIYTSRINQPQPSVTRQPSKYDLSQSTQQGLRHTHSFNSLSTKMSSRTCTFCNASGHSIFKCNQFKALEVSKRRAAAELSKLCFNCLQVSHMANKCPSSSTCHVCQRMHHTMLHLDGAIARKPAVAVKSVDAAMTASHSTFDSITAKNSVSSCVALPSRKSPYIILATAQVIVYDKFETPFIARAFLDSGSQLNFMTTALATRLGLKLRGTTNVVSGIGATSVSVKHSTTVLVKSRISHFSANINCLVLPKITDCQPSVPISRSDINIPGNLQLADPDFDTPQQIDLLIGASMYFELLSVGQIKLANHLPVLQNTQFGWVISGKIDSAPSSSSNLVLTALSTPAINDQIERFWKVDEIPAGTKAVTTFDDPVDKHFVTTHTRDIDGRFIVRLPFTETPVTLGNSSSMAKLRFFSLEKRLLRHPDLRVMYQQFMDEYRALSHMKQVPETKINPINYYLPHHCVLKPDSSTTKLRVVFDGSAKSSNNKSLNDLLSVGPVVQTDLFLILCRFRSHAYAISADIVKFYRQIGLQDDDCCYQYIYWRDDPTKRLETYELKRLTYGTSSSAFLATRCLLQLALENFTRAPTASLIIQNDFYVDDLLTGANSIAKAIQLRSEITEILHSGAMNLQKWCSNSNAVLHDIPESECEKVLNGDDDAFVKTLGLLWKPEEDVFKFNVQMSTDARITKRTVLSEVARIFDPIGLLSPIVVLGKLFIQKLWLLKGDWDQALPMHLHTEWQIFRSELKHIQGLAVPRHIFGNIEEPKDIQLHGFADASEKAYGAAIYTRCYLDNNTYVVRLMCSKSRVAPIQKSSLARLELCAAFLLAQLMRKILDNINFTVQKVFYWSDSTIALNWIHGTPTNWNTFVANRVSTIQNLCESHPWIHITSKSNPADIVSRGMRAVQLLDCDLWFLGPTFLHLPEQEWFVKFSSSVNINDIPEVKKLTNTMLSCSDATSGVAQVLDGLKYRNDYQKVVTTMSYVSRFKNNLKSAPKDRILRPLDARDYEAGVQLIIYLIQHECYGDVFKKLSKGELINDVNLKSLLLFIDKNNLIRVGGRMQFASLAYSAKHPILLPSKHYITESLLTYLHRKYLHVGPQALLSIVRDQFWPINGMQVAKRICRQCVRCAILRPRIITQLMGDLPAERVKIASQFYNTAMDFCGPVFIHHKVRGKQPTKTYICIFVCLATKAIHMELVADLSSMAFLNAFSRFTSTRGLCKHVFTDRGTNFVGANSELNSIYKMLQSSEIDQEIRTMSRDDQINWHFYPPCAPHFGGLHEAAVKSAKFHLRRVMATASLTYEELNTLVKQVEAVLNSRPLCAKQTSNADEIFILTPGHFLIGRPLVSIPETDIREKKVSLKQRWELLVQLKQHFWNRWSKDYLQSLQHRRKWTSKSRNIKVGEIVIIRDDNVPSLKWKKGRIAEIHPGADGLVRVVTIKTATGFLKRPITKICPLPIETSEIEPLVQGGEDVNEA